MIRFENVSKEFSNKVQAVDRISLEIARGELVALIGPSGSGKTTTMRMINRLIEPSAGTIWLDGQDIKQVNPVELRRSIGYVIQHVGLLPHLTIAENIALVPKLLDWPAKQMQERVHMLLDMVGLGVYGSAYPRQLSGGQQQRVGVARALAADPPLILMDEPFSALDPISREQLQDELLALQAKLHKTIVFVTHDIDEAIKIADRICLMKNGQVVQFAAPEEMLQHPANGFVEHFIGSQRIRRSQAWPQPETLMVPPVTARPQRGVWETLNQMRSHRVDTVFVVDDEKRLLGVVGLWELQQAFVQEKRTLQECMTLEVPFLALGQDLSTAIQLLDRHQLSCLPVINSQQQVMGVVTRAVLVTLMAKEMGSRLPRTGGVAV